MGVWGIFILTRSDIISLENGTYQRRLGCTVLTRIEITGKSRNAILHDLAQSRTLAKTSALFTQCTHSRGGVGDLYLNTARHGLLKAYVGV